MIAPSSGLRSGTFIMSFSSSSISSGERVDSRVSRSGSSLTWRPVRVRPLTFLLDMVAKEFKSRLRSKIWKCGIWSWLCSKSHKLKSEFIYLKLSSCERSNIQRCCPPGCPAVHSRPGYHNATTSINPDTKRLDSLSCIQGYQWRTAPALASSKWPVRLRHSSESSESACPYLVQGTHSFKGNGEG